MTKIITYTIQPKEINEDTGEELDLSQYVISENANDVIKYQRSLAIADKLVTLPVLENHKIIELISDQEIEFYIYDVLTEKITFSNITHIILDADLNYNYKIKNLSDDTANIEWRLYL